MKKSKFVFYRRFVATADGTLAVDYENLLLNFCRIVFGDRQQLSSHTIARLVYSDHKSVVDCIANRKFDFSIRDGTNKLCCFQFGVELASDSVVVVVAVLVLASHLIELLNCDFVSVLLNLIKFWF